MNAKDIFKARRSVRKFKPDLVPDADIEEIILAASLAPTARNVQPWEFIVIKDHKTRSAIAHLAVNGPFLAQAPVCIAVFCKDTKYYLEDGCAATTQAMLCAVTLGYGSCWVAGDKKEYASEVAGLLGTPPGYKLVSMIALGRPLEIPSIPEKRNPKQMIHKEKF
jgi:nitroreductase